MAITFTNLGASSGTTAVAPDIRDINDLTSYTIPSWNPPDDGIVMLCIFNGRADGEVVLNSVTGNGNVWNSIGDWQYPQEAVTRGIEIQAAYGSQLSEGATVIEYDIFTQLMCYVSIFHVQGANEIPPIYENLRNPVNNIQADGSGTSTDGLIVNNEGPFNSESRGLLFLAHNANEAITLDPTWVKLDDMNGAGPAVGMITAYDPDGISDPDCTWTTSTGWGAVMLELKSATAPGPSPTLYQVRSNQRW